MRLEGSGPNETSWRKHAARICARERIIFEGAINHDRIRDFYAADDAELRKWIGKSGRASVVDHYDLRRRVERLARIFAERLQA